MPTSPPPEQKDPHSQVLSWAPGTMIPLKMLVLVMLLLGASLQVTHAGESQGEVAWDRRGGGTKITAAMPIIYALVTAQLVLQGRGGWQQQDFEGGIQRKRMRRKGGRPPQSLGINDLGWVLTVENDLFLEALVSVCFTPGAFSTPRASA